MPTKKILGLDIGTNSIGAALINLPYEYSDYGTDGNIEWIGSRIIPIDGDYLQKFESGSQAETKAAFRRSKRGARRLKHRYKLRRTRLIKVLKTLGWVKETYPLDDSRKFKHDINENGYSLKISDEMPFSEQTITEFEKELGIDGNKSKKKGSRKGGKSIVPEDWIVYYLRKKALTQKIEITELVRIIYLLNQRRGFKSSRKDLKDTNILPYAEFLKEKNNPTIIDGERKEIKTQFVSIAKIKSVTFKEEKKDKKENTVANIYTITTEDSRLESWEESRKQKPDWEGKEFTFLVEQKVDKNGKPTQNKPQMPKEDNWALCTTALSEKIEEKHQHPGEFFFEELKKAYKENRSYKIRQYPVYRWRYQKELEAIWKKQCELNPELNKLNVDKNTLIKLAEILYPTQAKFKLEKFKEFESNDLLHIISKDIIYYQRELKSQKNSISECRYEKRKGIDYEMYGLKCIPRSSPLFQEFRIWQDIHNIKILKREEKVDGKTKIDVDQSSAYINEIVKEKLYDIFNSKANIFEKDILELIVQCNENNDIVTAKKGDAYSHRINLFSNRDSLKGNETLVRYRSVFKKAEYDGEAVLNDREKLMQLWHIDYSITSSDEEKSKKGITSGLTKLLPDYENKDKVIEAYCKLSELKKEYGSFSACAIKKLLSVMRCGNYWNEKEIAQHTIESAKRIEERLESIEHNPRRIGEIADDDVKKQMLKSFIGKENMTKGLNTHQSGYLIYDRHSEKDTKPVVSVEQFTAYIQKEIPNNSLRNPIVEQVVRETMFLVRDVWNKYGDIDEIHIELGRDLKNNTDERKKISDSQKSNFDEKQRIKKLLYELMNDGFRQYIDDKKIEQTNFEVNPNPESPVDIDKFRIWRSLTKQSEFDWAKKIKEEQIPTEQELKKYALWLSQHCRSPYTGKIIPLSKLFDTAQYEIEHIIPRSKMKNDSFNNLVIAEWGVNKAKDKQLAANFIGSSKGKSKYGDIEYSLFTYEEYDKYCSETFKFQKSKRKNLLATEPPDDFVERQLNDTRYIGRKLSELLTPVVKNENGIIFTGGSITSELKNNWGLNSVWKDIIRPRFERLEKIIGKPYIVHDKDEYGNPVIHFNVMENQSLNTKRIDHRHHALDALIIAATTREHIRYLNTLSAADSDDEHRKIRMAITNPVSKKIRDFRKPWEKFTQQAKEELEKTIVSFKMNNKIISQPKNRTAYLNVENGKAKRDFKEQKPNERWMSVRKSMFKEPLGVIWLKEIKTVPVKVAFEIEINRQLSESDKEKRKTAAYIYDKQARQIIKQIISQSGITINDKKELFKEIANFLESNNKSVPTGKMNKNGKVLNKIVYILNGTEYENIHIAEFVRYKTKRMKLTNKDYVEKLTIEKMKNDFPYFSEDVKRNNAFNNLFLQHIGEYNNDPKEAFSSEGLDKLNKKAIDNPKIRKPIYTVTRLDGTVNENDIFKGSFYEADKGAMAYFIMYENQKTRLREGFQSIPTHKAIERITDKTKSGISDEKEGYDLIVLSPGDLVYVPTKEETEKINLGGEIEKAIDWKNKNQVSERIYQMRKSTGTSCYFLKSNIANLILPYSEYDKENKKKYGEFGSQNLLETSIDDITIKDVCIKLNVNRVGSILPITFSPPNSNKQKRSKKITGSPDETMNQPFPKF